MKSRSRSLRLSLLVGALSALLAQLPALASPSVASAQPRGAASEVRGEVMIVLAAPTEGEIDATLAEVPALRQPPFSSFGSMRLLGRPRFRLREAAPHQLPLPNGRTLRIELLERAADGRLRVRISINRRGQSDYLPLLQVMASPGEPFFVAGQSYLEGTLVIGITLGSRPAAPAGARPGRGRKGPWVIQGGRIKFDFSRNFIRFFRQKRQIIES